MFHTDLFIFIKNTLELNILISFLEKEWNYNCKQQKNLPLKNPTWIKINRKYKNIEPISYFIITNENYPKKHNVLILKHIKKWGPYTNNELRL
jgi:hypothetical protein